MKKVIWLVGLLFIYVSSSFAQVESTSAPLVELPVGKDKLIFSDYRGKVILLDFWASWCGPCRQSFPWMNDVQARYADQGLVVIAVNLDQDKQGADEFLRDIPATFKIVYDPEGTSAEQMDVMGMPMSYLIDRDGILRHRLIGFNSRKKIQHEDHIRALLDETVRK